MSCMKSSIFGNKTLGDEEALVSYPGGPVILNEQRQPLNTEGKPLNLFQEIVDSLSSFIPWSSKSSLPPVQIDDGTSSSPTAGGTKQIPRASAGPSPYVPSPGTTGSPAKPPATAPAGLLGGMSDTEKVLLIGGALGVAYMLFNRKKGRR